MDALYRALIEMQTKAQLSMEHELQLQSREMQSRMLALQSQMNPHFLYNSLSAIQAMADENMTEEIDMMCQSMSRLLRYISSGSEQLVNLSDELLHTKGMTPSRYLKEYRMKIAMQMLRDPSIPISTISTQTGFLDQFHFSKTFKGYAGVSPSSYRARILGEEAGGS